MEHIESGILSSDTLLKTGAGYVLSITIGYKGVTAGDFVALKDGLTVGASDAAVFVLPAANGTINKEWPADGKVFATGIFFHKNTTGGSVWAEVSWA